MLPLTCTSFNYVIHVVVAGCGRKLILVIKPYEFPVVVAGEAVQSRSAAAWCIAVFQFPDKLLATAAALALNFHFSFAFGASVGHQEEHPAGKKIEWWGAGMVMCLERVHMVYIWSGWCHFHPIVSCFVKIQTGLTFLVPAYPGCPG